MFDYLKGLIEEIIDNHIILDVNGIGYDIISSSRTINEAKNHGNVIKLYTVLNIREDAWTLFGFISQRERFWFNKLNSVQGVGGRVAISILSVLSDDDIYNAFVMEDKNSFTKADGVGLKLATRIITELKDKVIGQVDSTAFTEPMKIQSNVVNDVISALVNLGYQKFDILRVISNMNLGESPQFDVLLRQVLTKISTGARS